MRPTCVLRRGVRWGPRVKGREERSDEALTRRRFVPHQHGAGGEPVRIYRTGDLVRRGADGSLVYVGRTDFQIKLHGHRIELGEIEHVLATHSAVKEAVVLLGSSSAPPLPDGASSWVTQCKPPQLAKVRNELLRAARPRVVAICASARARRTSARAAAAEAAVAALRPAATKATSLPGR